MIQWLLDLFTFQPITQITITNLFYLYGLYFIVAFTIAIPFILLFRKKRKSKPLTITKVLIGVPIEDALFRFLPLHFLGSTALIYAHFLWAVCHGYIPNIIFVVVHGLLDLRLWLGGLWIEAVFIHLFHDLVCVAIVQSLSRIGENE